MEEAIDDKFEGIETDTESDKETGREAEKESDKENEIDERWAKAERMLTEIQPGWTLSIARIRPNWCSGFLERLECTEGEPLDLDYIVSHWGGEVLRLRLCDNTGTYRKGAQLNLRSYPPKFRGRVIYPEDYYEDEVSKRRKNTERSQYQLPVQPPPVQFDLNGILQMLQKMRKEDFTTLQNLIGSAPQPVNQPKPRSSLDELIEFATKWKQLQNLFATDKEPQPSEEAGFLGTFSEILKALQGSKSSTQRNDKQQKKGRVVAPKDTESEMLPSRIASLNPEKFSETILTSLEMMDESKREKVIQTFMDRSGFGEDDPDADDEDYEEDDFGDRPHSDA